jgi:hypothetical protein
MRRICQAVLLRDIKWIYDEFNFMIRLWVGTENERGMRARREHERALIFPYVNATCLGTSPKISRAVDKGAARSASTGVPSARR